MRSGSFTCLRQDCPKDVAPGRDCSRCDMPFVDRNTVTSISLYNRCRSWGTLPMPGGVMQQSEHTMWQFDIMDAVIAKHKKRLSDEQQDQATLALRMKKTDGRH